MDKKRSSDFLSDLPPSIICDILSLVPIKDAVRTSILSRQWRFIWCSLPRLAFDDTHAENEGDIQRLLYFINQALLLHKGPIHEFQLLLVATSGLSTLPCEYINQWLLFLSRNDIRILDINIYECSYVVNSSLYSCQNLTCLKLHVDTIPTPPSSFKGFLLLRSLDIFVVEDDSSTIECILAHSPLLEELTLDSSSQLNLTIRALNLLYLHFRCAHGLTLCTPLLQELNGCFEYTTFFSIGVESLVFHHLSTIKLYYVPFDEEDVTGSVIRLITGSPNLQKLEIESRCVSYEVDEPGPDCFWDADSAPDITYNSLQVIKMEDCGGGLSEMKLIKFLLARSPVLETLIYNPSSSKISETKLLNLMTQLLMYRRASTNAQIVIGEIRKQLC